MAKAKKKKAATRKTARKTTKKKPAARAKTKRVAKHKSAVARKPAKPVKAEKVEKKEIVKPEPKLPKLKLPAQDRRRYEAMLFSVRDRLLDGISSLATNNLRNSQKESSGDISSYSTHMADAGTDAFDREFALSLVSNEQDALYEVTEALKRLENQSFGLCEICAKPIPRARLEVLPFARHCIKCQELSEKENRHPRRQAQQAIAQFEETEEAEAEAEEEKEKEQA